jgi:hypothetical protein
MPLGALLVALERGEVYAAAAPMCVPIGRTVSKAPAAT